MGLFRKNPSEKKLKELTGGFVLNNEFISRLKDNGLEIRDGSLIQSQLKDEIKEGLPADDVGIRLNQLIVEYKKQKTDSVLDKTCPRCSTKQEFENTFCINCGYEFNRTKNCPICDTSQEDSNIFCINCGYDFASKNIANTKKECPNCRKSQYIRNKTCSDCGYDFESEKLPNLLKKCPSCNLLQKSANMFCRNCKQDLRDVDYEPCEELVECSHCGRMIPANKDMCPFCKFDFNKFEREKIEKQKKEEKIRLLNALDTERKATFLANYEFNLKTCPDCNTKFLKADPFCFNCGASVLTKQTVKNDNLEVKDGKLVAKDESNQKDELTDLEALYSQTVQSKYAPAFKVAYVLYLEEFRKNPTKKFSDRLAKHYDTTPKKLNRQALEDEFIEPAPPLNVAKDFKVSDLKEILKEHNLKVSGKKDELIERLGENLSEDELKKYFKSKTYQISDSGLEFLSKNSCILYIYNSKDISRVFYPSEIGKIFEEKQYSETEIQDIILKYLKRIFDEKLTQERWVDFKIYANAIAEVMEDKGELKDALNVRLKVFLFDLNNFSIVTERPNPRNTKLKQKDMSKLMELMHNLALSIDDLKEEFGRAYNEVLFEVEITKEDSLIYLLKIFGGEDLDKISAEINESYSNPH